MHSFYGKVGLSESFCFFLLRFGANLSVVANQSQREKALCAEAKLLEMENVTDIEYCVLETIAK